MSSPYFMYSLEDANGNTIMKPNSSLDIIVKYLDENNTSANHFRVLLIRTGMPNIILYTRTEALPDLSNEGVRKIFNLQ